MAKFFVVLLFGAALGIIFGGVGFWAGIVLGIVGWIGFTKIGAGATRVPAQANSPVFTGNEHGSTVPSPPSFARPSSDQVCEYASCVLTLYAGLLSFYPKNDSSQVKQVTELLKLDAWIVDKAEALQELAKRLSQAQAERVDSLIHFQLHSSALVERLLRLPSQMKSLLAIRMDVLEDSVGEFAPKDCKDYIEAVRVALRQDSPVSRERLDAEKYILRSGDATAISTLKEMRRNPSGYRELLKTGATGNSVLKIALGVFVGILAADAVKAAVTENQIKTLLAELDDNLALAGGIDSLLIPDEELDAVSSIESDSDFAAGFGDAVLDDEDDLPVDDSSDGPHSYFEGAEAEADVEVEEVDDADSDVHVAVADSNEDASLGTDN